MDAQLDRSLPTSRSSFRKGFGFLKGLARHSASSSVVVGQRNRSSLAVNKEKVWIPVTKLGRLVKCGKITSFEELALYSLPVKEPEIIDFFLGSALRMEVLATLPISNAFGSNRIHFKAIIGVGDVDGHVGFGVKCSREMAAAIRGAGMAAKLSIIPVRRGAWGNGVVNPNTVSHKVAGSSENCSVRVLPGPSGSGIIAPYPIQRLLLLAGIKDAFVLFRAVNVKKDSLETLVNATFDALGRTYAHSPPSTCGSSFSSSKASRCPYDEYTDFLMGTFSKAVESPRNRNGESQFCR